MHSVTLDKRNHNYKKRFSELSFTIFQKYVTRYISINYRHLGVFVTVTYFQLSLKFDRSVKYLTQMILK
jgi:hypothetical protein